MESYFEGSDIDLDDLAPIAIPEGLPWLDPGPIFGFELAQYESETDPLLVRQRFAEVGSVVSECFAMCTDGSGDGDGVASATVFGRQVCHRSSVQRLMQFFLLRGLLHLLNSLSCLLAVEL